MAREAAQTPCGNCPWRLSNQGKRHPSGWYRKANLRRLWKGLRRGEPMSCHVTDVNNPVTAKDEAAGYRPAPEGTEVRECAGAVVLCQREAMVFQGIVKELGPGRRDGLAVYRKRRPGGLTREGMAEVVARVLYAGTPFAAKMPKPDLNQSDVGHPDLPWPPPNVTLPESG